MVYNRITFISIEPETVTIEIASSNKSSEETQSNVEMKPDNSHKSRNKNFRSKEIPNSANQRRSELILNHHFRKIFEAEKNKIYNKKLIHSIQGQKC